MSGFYGNMPNQNTFNPSMFNPYQQNIDRLNQQVQQYQQQLNGQQNGVQSPTNMEFIKVANMQQAKEWVVQNGQSVWMQDSSEPYLYYKSVDNLGSANFRILKVDDVTNSLLNNNKQDLQDDINYVPIDKFNELQNQVKLLYERLNTYESLISKDVEVKEDKNVNKQKSNSKPKEGAK